MPAVKAYVRLSDAYYELVRQMPLIPIRDEAHLDAATAVLHRLLQQNLGADEEAYLDVLTDLVYAYEQEHHALPPASEADVLRFLLDVNQMTQAAFAEKAGIAPSTVSSILKGTRSFTKDQVIAAAAVFNSPPAIFLPRGERGRGER